MESYLFQLSDDLRKKEKQSNVKNKKFTLMTDFVSRVIYNL